MRNSYFSGLAKALVLMVVSLYMMENPTFIFQPFNDISAFHDSVYNTHLLDDMKVEVGFL